MSIFQLPPTLIRLSAIAISKQLCASLKDRLKSSIDAENSMLRQAVPMRLAAELLINDFPLPESVKEELKYVVASMGHKILHWFVCAIYERGNYREPPSEHKLLVTEPNIIVDYIRWTTFGGLDEAETMRTLYFAGLLAESMSTWNSLVKDCLEDCLKDFRAKRPNIDELINQYVMPLLQGDTPMIILHIYWMERTSDNEESRIIDAFQRLAGEWYDDAYSLDENMFMYAMVKYRDSPVTYFWGLLNDNQRRRTLVTSCEKMIADYRCWIIGHRLIFITQQLAHYGLEDIRIRMMCSADILSDLLDWPHDNLFMMALGESLRHHDIVDYDWITHKIFMRICFYSARNSSVKHREAFYTLWRMNLGNFKSSTTDHLRQLWEAKEVELLNYILGDPELKDRRKGFLEKLAKEFEDSWVDRDFFRTFVTQALVPGEEWFSKSFYHMQMDVDV